MKGFGNTKALYVFRKLVRSTYALEVVVGGELNFAF